MDDDDIIVTHESINSNEIEEKLFETLSVEDWLTIQSVRSLFLSIFENDNGRCSSIDVSNHITALITWSQFINRVALLFINFFRQIREFQDLHLDDRFILIKYNIFSVFPISKCFYYKPIDDCCSNDDNEIAEKIRRFFMLCGDSYGIRDAFVNNVHSLVELTEQDPILLSLLSTILIFSQGLSMNENQPSLKDSLAVNRAEFYYTKLLWNYMVNKWGEIQACKHFTQLLAMIFRIQSMAKKNQEFFRVQYMTSNTADRIAPIIQSVLHIS
jgi:hypothetical protein